MFWKMIIQSWSGQFFLWKLYFKHCTCMKMSLEEEENRRFKDWNVQMVGSIETSKNALHCQGERVCVNRHTLGMTVWFHDWSLISKNLEKIQKLSKKSLKIKNFITFKIQLLFYLIFLFDQKLNDYHSKNSNLRNKKKIYLKNILIFHRK